MNPVGQSPANTKLSPRAAQESQLNAPRWRCRARLWLLASSIGGFLVLGCEPGSGGSRASSTAEPGEEQSEPSSSADSQRLAQAELERWKWGFAGQQLDPDGEKSGAGESCGWTGDCETELGLICVGGQCVAAAPEDEFGVVPTPPQRTGDVGESCLARRDCNVGLVCFGGTCLPEGSVGNVREDAGAGPPVGAAGETCQSRLDCGQGLACLDGQCLPVTAGIAPSPKACVVVECQEPVDCCPASAENCGDLAAACEASDPDSLICSRFEANCECDGSLYSCNGGQCGLQFTCSDLVLCPGLMVCDDGNCVRCVSDNDCPGGARCTNNECAQACEFDTECNRFHQCQDGACVDVGCQTDRECKAFLSNPQAVCQDGNCFSTCATDLNCGAAEGSNRICVDQTCLDAGCETDEECRLHQANGLLDTLLAGTSDTASYSIECRAPSQAEPEASIETDK